MTSGDITEAPDNVTQESESSPLICVHSPSENNPLGLRLREQQGLLTPLAAADCLNEFSPLMPTPVGYLAPTASPLTWYPPAKKPPDETKVGLFSSAINLANSAVGAGVIAFPYAFECMGIVGGIFMTLLAASLVTWSLYVVSQSAIQKQAVSYQNLVQLSIGETAATCLRITAVIYLFGSNVGNLVIVGDIAQPVFEYTIGKSIFSSRIFVITFFTLTCAFPLTFYRRIHKLASFSFVAVFFIVYLCILITMRGAQMLSITGISTLFFALQCHLQIIPISRELRDCTPRRMLYIIVAAMVLCSCLYITTGVFGMLTCYQRTRPDILTNFALEDIPMDTGKFGVTFTVLFSYPLMNFPARLAVDDILLSRPSYRKWSRKKRFWIETVVMAVLALCLALFVPNLQVVIGFMGALAMIFMVILPAIVWYNSCVYI